MMMNSNKLSPVVRWCLERADEVWSSPGTIGSAGALQPGVRLKVRTKISARVSSTTTLYLIRAGEAVGRGLPLS